MTKEQKLEVFIDSIGLRYFKGREFTPLWKRTRRDVVNSVPPERLWPNVVKTIIVLDEVRHRMRESVRLSSSYRSPEYNRAVGGEQQSYHLIFNAIDFQSKMPPVRVAAIARLLRGTRFRLPGGSSFTFRGGIGVYRTFVHIDTRGIDANW